MRVPDSLPNRALAAGTDTIPEIEHVVVLMLENHSYDNLFGMLGRQPGGRPRGDGFALARRRAPERDQPVPRRSAPARVPNADDLPVRVDPEPGVGG